MFGANLAKIIHFWSKFSQNKIGGLDGSVSDVNTDSHYIQVFPKNNFFGISSENPKMDIFNEISKLKVVRSVFTFHNLLC